MGWLAELFLNKYTMMLVGALGLMGGSYLAGEHHVQKEFDQYKEEQRNYQEVQRLEDHVVFQDRVITLTQTITKIQTVTKTVTVQVEKVVEKPIYANVCFEPDGLQLANAALTGSTPTDPQGAPGQVPGPEPPK